MKDPMRGPNADPEIVRVAAALMMASGMLHTAAGTLLAGSVDNDPAALVLAVEMLDELNRQDLLASVRDVIASRIPKENAKP